MRKVTNAAPASATARLFSNYVNLSHLTQREIAARAGYPRPNIITMFKTGETKIPIEKIPVFAEILGIDSKRFLRIALQEYSPNVLAVIERRFGPQISRNEAEILQEIRKRSNGADPKLVTQAQRDAIGAFVARLLT
jgi:transcriptional regulator with XRE-family HTH domain